MSYAACYYTKQEENSTNLNNNMNETVQVVDNHEVFTVDRSQTDLAKVH